MRPDDIIWLATLCIRANGGKAYSLYPGNPMGAVRHFPFMSWDQGLERRVPRTWDFLEWQRDYSWAS